MHLGGLPKKMEENIGACQEKLPFEELLKKRGEIVGSWSEKLCFGDLLKKMGANIAVSAILMGLIQAFSKGLLIVA